jgi:hypothetical protein
VHLLVLSQIGNADRDAAKNQRNHNHFKQIDKQRTDQARQKHACFDDAIISAQIMQNQAKRNANHSAD